MTDGYNYTLEEVGRIFKVTRERVRQIEAKAVRKLQNPVRAKELEGFVPASPFGIEGLDQNFGTDGDSQPTAVDSPHPMMAA